MKKSKSSRDSGVLTAMMSDEFQFHFQNYVVDSIAGSLNSVLLKLMASLVYNWATIPIFVTASGDNN